VGFAAYNMLRLAKLRILSLFDFLANKSMLLSTSDEWRVLISTLPVALFSRPQGVYSSPGNRTGPTTCQRLGLERLVTATV
jgi:hypothetical protein